MRRAASWTQPWQVRSGPRGARRRRGPASVMVAVDMVTPLDTVLVARPALYYSSSNLRLCRAVAQGLCQTRLAEIIATTRVLEMGRVFRLFRPFCADFCADRDGTRGLPAQAVGFSWDTRPLTARAGRGAFYRNPGAPGGGFLWNSPHQSHWKVTGQ